MQASSAAPPTGAMTSRGSTARTARGNTSTWTPRRSATASAAPSTTRMREHAAQPGPHRLRTVVQEHRHARMLGYYQRPQARGDRHRLGQRLRISPRRLAPAQERTVRVAPGPREKSLGYRAVRGPEQLAQCRRYPIVGLDAHRTPPQVASRAIDPERSKSRSTSSANSSQTSSTRLPLRCKWTLRQVIAPNR